MNPTDSDGAELVSLNTFSEFSDASNCARSLAKEHAGETLVQRTANGWEVFIPSWLKQHIVEKEREFERGPEGTDGPKSWEEWAEENSRNSSLYDDAHGDPDPARPRDPIVNYTGPEEPEDAEEQ